MQNTNSSSRRKSRFLALLLAIAIVLFLAKEFLEYAAAPADEKTSDFVYPPIVDQTKPTTLLLGRTVPTISPTNFSTPPCSYGKRIRTSTAFYP